LNEEPVSNANPGWRGPLYREVCELAQRPSQVQLDRVEPTAGSTPLDAGELQSLREIAEIKKRSLRQPGGV